MSNVLSCFFPSTIVMVDDNPAFLDSLQSTLSGNNLTLKQFFNPKDALDFVNSSIEINTLSISKLLLSSEMESSDTCSSKININVLHDMIYSEDRFSQISAVIADYSMPGMNGVEFCSKIKNSNVQKVLLTGIANEKIAIEAFNGKHIDKFVKKDHIDFDSEVLRVTRNAVHQYFSSYTEDLVKYLPTGSAEHLKDPVFANFFRHACLNKSYTEYYLLDPGGSYLFLSESGQPSLLSVATESEVDRLIQVATDSGDAQSDMLADLRSKEYMLVYHSRSGTLPPVSEWNKHLGPARRLEGYQTYFFNFTSGEALDIRRDNICSYQKFKIHIW
ncbi:MAG: response regulator [Alphaproteobacteria bacterium]|nr:response regulator [Alphaproteobacteria bacterium]